MDKERNNRVPMHLQMLKNMICKFTYSQNSVAGVVAFAPAVQLDEIFVLSNSKQYSKRRKKHTMRYFN